MPPISTATTTLTVVAARINSRMTPLELVAFTEDPLGNLAMFLIPSVILGTASAAVTMRMTRTMMLEVRENANGEAVGSESHFFLQRTINPEAGEDHFLPLA